MNPQEDDLYAVGRIIKAFGIRGEVVVLPMTDSPERFKSMTRVYFGVKPAMVKEARVERVTIQPRGVKVKLDVIGDRTAAEGIVGQLLFVHARDSICPGKGAYFVHDLIGLTVVDEQGAVVGVVKDVLRLPAHDVYVVDASGQEMMIPAAKEFVRDIDLSNKTMKVRLIEGMRE